MMHDFAQHNQGGGKTGIFRYPFRERRPAVHHPGKTVKEMLQLIARQHAAVSGRYGKPRIGDLLYLRPIGLQHCILPAFKPR